MLVTVNKNEILDILDTYIKNCNTKYQQEKDDRINEIKNKRRFRFKLSFPFYEFYTITLEEAIKIYEFESNIKDPLNSSLEEKLSNKLYIPNQYKNAINFSCIDTIDMSEDDLEYIDILRNRNKSFKG